MPDALLYTVLMDDEERREEAIWRATVLGPLVSARLEHGDVRRLCEEAAARVLERRDGRSDKVSWRTIETWYYAYKAHGLDGLRPLGRNDRGETRAIRPEVADLIVRAKREKPRRSIRRIIRILERAKVVPKGELKKSSVHRLLLHHGISARPGRGDGVAVSKPRLAWICEHAGDLWVGDAKHGPLVIAPDGRVRKCYLLSQIDSATRFVVHSFFALSEGAVEHERGFREALLKYGRPRGYYIDRGSAYKADSLRAICAELAIDMTHTQPRDAAAKGVIERWQRTYGEEVEDELPDHPLPLHELNAILWAWLRVEYHARPHDTTGQEPLRHWLSEVHHLRPLPAGKDLAEVFLHRITRKVRKDATLRFFGKWLEVRAELCGQRVQLRFDPTDAEALPRVFVADRFHSDTVLLDRVRNASRRRRAPKGTPDPQVEPTGLDPLQQMLSEYYQDTRPGWGDDEPPHHKED
ncbi:MAG: transposase [Deltaproteobacteria bacterium]|nr:transposase [Deltaproteobacteria bacterium]